MGSVTCERCGFVSFATSEVCKQCGGPLPGPSAARNWRPPQPPQPNWQQQQQAAQDWQPQQQAHAAGQWPPPAQGWLPPQGDANYYQSRPGHYGTDDGLPKRKGTAVVSLLCGLLAVPVMIVGGVAAVSLGAPALILGGIVGLAMTLVSFSFGIVGLVRVNKNPSEYGGKGMAIAGVILGSLLLVSVIPVGIIAAVAVPNLMASLRAANEASAIQSLRTLAQAQAIYQSTAGDGEYGTLEDLRNAALISPEAAAEVHNGYRYELFFMNGDYQLTATPVDYPNSGIRSFYVSEDGVVRGANKNGEAADANDPPITSGGYGDPASADGGEDVEWSENGPVIRRTGSRLNGGR